MLACYRWSGRSKGHMRLVGCFEDAGVIEIKLSGLRWLPEGEGYWICGLHLENGGPGLGEMSPETRRRRRVRKARWEWDVHERTCLVALVFMSACGCSNCRR